MPDKYGLDPDADYESVPWCTDIGEEHRWGPWVLSPAFAGREDHFCSRCGGMEAFTLNEMGPTPDPMIRDQS